jgi:hypothetical protein
MRRLLIWMVLLMHVNTYMFFPMIDEEDVYECNGKQRDDINSLVEFVNQVLLGNRDSTPEDEDDDQVHFYHIKSAHYYATPYAAYLPEVATCQFSFYAAKLFHIPADQRIRDVFYDIVAPPPKALTVC